MKLSGIPGNVQILKFIQNTFPYLKSSEAVIAPGGHSTMMEALSFGIPVLSFPDKGHTEQQNNAEVIEEEGYGRMLSYLHLRKLFWNVSGKSLKIKNTEQKPKGYADLPEN